MFIGSGQKFGKLRIKVPQEVSPGSGRKIEWVCDCGRETVACIRYVISGRTSSCGNCNLVSSDAISCRKFGKLRIRVPQDVKPGSEKKVEWICDCGKFALFSICKVLSGETTRCGKCNIITADEMKGRKFGKLHIKHPHDVLPGSHKKEEWVCDCGSTSSVSIMAVLAGRTASCGKCNLILAKDLIGRKLRKLTVRVAQDTLPRSEKKLECVCDCGNTVYVSARSFLSGNTGSCGRCRLISAADLAEKKFGRLRVEVPQDVFAGSMRKLWWVCDCGLRSLVSVSRVLSGRIKSCGNCVKKIHNWYTQYAPIIKELKLPISRSSFPVGGVHPLDDILNSYAPFRALCAICGSEYMPRFNDVKRGWSLTCGCSTNRTSLAQKNIGEFIKSIGVSIIEEFKSGGFKYDILIPNLNLLIEYNGLRWHSMNGARQRDARKYEYAVSVGYNFISIFEDEWVSNRSKVEYLLKNKCGYLKSYKIRPSACEIRTIPPQEADPFYGRFHYIGPCRPKVSYGVFYHERLIACVSFSHPTRQSRHPWELVRMASDPEYRVHGIWSKLLKRFVEKHRPSSIISFSDNRLFTGRVYERMGFKLDGRVVPDYYWVKGQKRFHKSALRKRGEERKSGLTERELREAQGYRRIWDLGKKRWMIEYSNGQA